MWACLAAFGSMTWSGFVAGSDPAGQTPFEPDKGQGQVGFILGKAASIFGGAGRVTGGGGAAAVSVRIVEQSDDIVNIVARSGGVSVEVVAQMAREGGDLVLRGAHVEASGALLRADIRAFAVELGRQQDATRVIVQGGVRRSGARPGHIPSPMIFHVPPL